MLGKIFREIRKENGFNRESIAKKAGLSHRTLVRIETDEGYQTSCENLIKLCDATGVSFEFFLRKAGIIDSQYPDTEEAIKQDKLLSEKDKEILKYLYKLLVNQNENTK